MNVPNWWSDNYIDATNEIIGGSGDTIIEGGTGNISDYLYITSNSNLYINNPNTNGEIRIKVINNIGNPAYSQDHRVRINSDGKLQLYHVYNPLTPTYPSGWYDVSDEIISTKFGNDLQQVEVIALGTTVGVIQGEIVDIFENLTTILTALGNVNNSLEFTQDLLYDNNVLNTNHGNLMKFRDNFNELMEDFVGTAVTQGVRQRAFESQSFVVNSVASILGRYGLGLQIGIPVMSGLIGAFYALQEDRNVYNKASNLSNVNFQITTTQRRQLLDSNLVTSVSNMANLASNLSNMSLDQGFINSNILIKQVVPYLRTNKIEIGNITTPNSSYQLEMTGDLNTNMLWINSTSLTSLLNQKQNNMSATQPIYITTSTIGLNYDSSLTKVGNNLSVVKTATSPLSWTGNDISLSYDSTLLNNSGSLGVSIGAESKWGFTGGNIYNKSLTNVGIGTLSSITSKLTIHGDIYTASNINCGIRPLTFITSFTNSSLTAVTGSDEFYLQYTTNGTLVLNEPSACDLLIVGAGGNGGTGASSGGGGSGEVIYYPNFPLRSGTLNINVGIQSSTPSNRNSSITHSSGTQIIARGGGNGGTSVFYSTSGGTVSALTAIAGTNDAYISITAGTTTLTLNANCIIDIFMIGGGGGGGYNHGGGGGAGAYYWGSNLNFNSGTYSITIGSGGTGPTSGDNQTSGQDTFIQQSSVDIQIGGLNVRCKGGGKAGTISGIDGSPGGCGGGADGWSNNTGTNRITNGGATNNSGTVGSGNRGGNGRQFYGSGALCAGGGGGIGNPGFYDAVGNEGSNGGEGLVVNIKGTNEVYGGGGGGGEWPSYSSAPAGQGGGAIVSGSYVKVGGDATRTDGGSAGNGVANTGSGGGGGKAGNSGGNGGSGIVIIRFKNYLTIGGPLSGGSGGGGGKSQIGAVAGVKFDDYKSFALAGLNGTSTNGANGGSGNTTYNTRYTSTITGSSLSVGLGGLGVGVSPAVPTTKSNYGDGGDGNGGVGFQGIVIIRFKNQSTNLHVKAIKDNANTGIIINANESPTSYQLRVYPWSDTYQLTGIVTRGWSFRCHDGNNNLDLLNLFSSFGGRIGIKTKNPTAILDVNGDINCKNFNVIGNEQYGITCQVVNQHDTGEASINVSAGASGNYGAMSIVYLPSENLGYINCSKSLQIKTQSIGGYIHIDNSTGNVGIGNNLPQAKLHVNGTVLASSVSVTTVNCDSIASGNISCTSLDLNSGSIIDCNRLNSVDVWTGPIKATSLDLDGGNITNGGFFYGMAQQARFLNMSTGEWHYDTQSRNRFYFTNDGTSSHTVFRTGSTSHYFQDKDATDYCILDRFGISTYFEVISGGGYDNLGVLDASVTGVYVYRKMLVRLSTFTEVHRCFCEDDLYLNYDQFINEFIGRIVVSKGKIKTALKEADKDWQILEGKDGITIDDSHPVVQLSRKRKDKSVVGVITKRNQNNDLPGRLVINSLGETGIWVVNTGGDIENGDLITTSNEIGYGEKQDCDFIKNYTIGKCMIDCSFELDSPNYKCEVIDEAQDLRRAFLPIFIYSG